MSVRCDHGSSDTRSTASWCLCMRRPRHSRVSHKGLTEPGLLPGGATPHGILENVLGSAVPAFIVTALVSGRTGVRDLARRTFKWRVPLRWYVISLLAPPLDLAARCDYSLRSCAFARARPELVVDLRLVPAGPSDHDRLQQRCRGDRVDRLYLRPAPRSSRSAPRGVADDERQSERKLPGAGP
jgi:hypothetical protein